MGASKLLVQHDIDRLTFDEMVFICQILWIKNQLTNQFKPKIYPNFTFSVIPVSNSNASSSNNNNFPVRGYMTPFTTITIFVQPPTPALIDQGDPMDLSIFKGPKKLLTPEKKTVLTITFAFIAGNQDIELWIIKLRFNGSISLHQLQLLRYQQKLRLPLKPPLLHNNNNKFKPCIQSFAKAITFFYFCFNFNISKFDGNFK